MLEIDVNAEKLIDLVVEDDLTAEEIIEAIKRTFRRPRKRRFGRRGPAVDPLTGKRKDPRRRLAARKAARRGRAARRRARKKFARSAKGKRFFKKLGKLTARIRRR